MRSKRVFDATYINHYEPDFTPLYFVVEDAVVEIQHVEEVDVLQADEFVIQCMY